MHCLGNEFCWCGNQCSDITNTLVGISGETGPVAWISMFIVCTVLPPVRRWFCFRSWCVTPQGAIRFSLCITFLHSSVLKTCSFFHCVLCSVFLCVAEMQSTCWLCVMLEKKKDGYEFWFLCLWIAMCSCFLGCRECQHKKLKLIGLAQLRTAWRWPSPSGMSSAMEAGNWRNCQNCELWWQLPRSVEQFHWIWCSIVCSFVVGHISYMHCHWDFDNWNQVCPCTHRTNLWDEKQARYDQLLDNVHDFKKYGPPPHLT